MKTTTLGPSGIRCSAIGLGTWAMGGWMWGGGDNAGATLAIQASLDAGVTLIDTAPAYGLGRSERLVGTALKGRRHEAVIATKCGLVWHTQKGTHFFEEDGHPVYRYLGRDAIAYEVEQSLANLQTDYIDLYQSHDDDANTPLEDTLGAFDDLVKAGKVRAIGASNFTAPRLAEALDVSERLGIARYESLQPLYNLYDRAVFEDELEPLCLKREVGVINFYALAAGFLTGKYRTEADAAKSARGASTTKKYLNPRGLRILEALDKVAQQYNAKPGQVAIAWQIARPSVTAPIASATSIAQLDELVTATQLKLDAGTIAMLDRASEEEGKAA